VVDDGEYNVPIVVMTPVGSGIHGSLYHSHSFDAIMTHLPGWKIVLPSTPIDTYGRTAPLAAKVATKLGAEGIEVEVIDLRSLWPWDRDMVFESVKKTGRFVSLNEDVEVTNFGEHIIREVTKECFYHLEAPPTLVAGANTPGIGLAWTLEAEQVPQDKQIEAALRSVVATKA